MKVSIFQLTLGKSAIIQVVLLNENGRQVKSEIIQLSGDDYKAWGADDQYIYSYVANKLQLLLPIQDDIIQV